jgi:putative transposase
LEGGFKDNGQLGLIDTRKTSSGRPFQRELTEAKKIKQDWKRVRNT